jgi:hypothetical protein
MSTSYIERSDTLELPPQFRNDDDLALFAQRQLTTIAAKVLDKRYPTFKMISGDIVPVVPMPESMWDEYIEVEEYDVFGAAEVIADYSVGGPRVGTIVRRNFYRIQTLGDHVAWSWLELNQARAKNRPLQAKRLEAARVAYESTADQIGYFGSPEYGLQGILTSQIPRYVSASTFAAAASGDALLALLNAPVSDIMIRTKGLAQPVKVVMPTSQYELIGNTMRATGSDLSVMSQFLTLQQAKGQISQIIVADQLKGAGRNGSDVMLVLPDDEDVICYGLPMDFDVIPEQQTNLEIVVHGLARIAGVLVFKPGECLIVEGI